MIKILISSVGSLVGQNILDVLEHPGFNRRNLLKIIGVNSLAESPNNFRCDKAYLLSLSSSAKFKDRIIEILKKEKPSIILNGRDEDTLVFKQILEDHPDLSCVLPYGTAKSIIIALDKLETWRFCQKYNLPFAETYDTKNFHVNLSFEDFINKVGFPLIAKPIQGFASKGVYYLRNRKEADLFHVKSNYLFQEYLGDASSLDNYFETIDIAAPLFSHAPNVFHYSCHTFIYPDGNTDQVFISKNKHQSGVTIEFERVNILELELITLRYAKAIYMEGGFGPLTIQFRQDKNGNWKAQEINIRTNGNTYPRFLMGQDDLGMIINTFCKNADFPIYIPEDDVSDFIFSKTYKAEIMRKSVLKRFIKDSFFDKMNIVE